LTNDSPRSTPARWCFIPPAAGRRVAGGRQTKRAMPPVDFADDVKWFPEVDVQKCLKGDYVWANSASLFRQILTI